MSKIKILIASDHGIVRAGLKCLLNHTSDIFSTDEAGNGMDALALIRKTDYDVVLFSISTSGRIGLDILRQIKIENPRLPVLTLSMHNDEEYGIRNLKAGSSGYLTKNSTQKELIPALIKLSEGRKYISPSLAEKLASNIGIDTDKLPHEILSNREYEVLCLIASGKTVKDVAQELSLSSKTISTYRSRILEKMRMKNNAELCFYAIRNGLID